MFGGFSSRSYFCQNPYNMYNYTKSTFFCAAALIFSFNLVAQQNLYQVIVLNEGYSDWQTGEVLEPATMGVYDPGLQVYAVVDTLEDAAFVSDAFVHDEMIFVAADGEILKYDANTHQLLQSVEVVGVRKMALKDGLIYVTRGDTDDQGLSLELDSYFQWFDLATLQLVGELLVSENGPQYSGEGIVISGDEVYVAINNAFAWGSEVGFFGAYNTVTDTYQEWDLGADGINPFHLFEVEDAIVSVNNRDYGSTSLSALNVAEATVETVQVSAANAGCLAAVALDQEVRFQITGEAAVRQTSPDALSVSTDWITDCPSFYGMAIDPVSGDVYGSVTDYSTYGFVQILDEAGVYVSEFECGVSPGVICMDVRELSDVAGASLTQDQVQNAQVRYDAAGRRLNNSSRIGGFTVDEQGRKSIMLNQR